MGSFSDGPTDKRNLGIGFFLSLNRLESSAFVLVKVMTSFLILNLFVAVIMDNFDYLTR